MAFGSFRAYADVQSSSQPVLVEEIAFQADFSPFTDFHSFPLLNEASFGQILGLKDLYIDEVLIDPVIAEFYQERGYKPFWFDSTGRLRPEAEQALEDLEQSWSHGLNASKYYPASFDHIKRAVSPFQKIKLELMLTQGFTSYMMDLSGMRIVPEGLYTKAEYWRQPISRADALKVLISSSGPEHAVQSLLPNSQTYERLREELAHLVQESPAVYESLLPLSFSHALVTPGMSDKAMPDLRVRLNVPAKRSAPYHYDDTLVAAVIEFQKQYGLAVDGMIGENTLEILNRTKQDKIDQVVANLERLRWIPKIETSNHVIVNIPSARLWSIENGQNVFEMDVIVGSQRRPTYSFTTEIQGIRLNPDWTIPPTIKRKDILPAVLENPDYIYERGIELMSGYGADAYYLDPSFIDWENLSKSELNRIRMIQPPSDYNPLGQYRVLMHNDYDIYLHDTSQPELFERTNRALSSGCIRLKEPHKMAEFILKQKKSWDRERIQYVVDGDDKTDIWIGRKIPIHILYQTTWMDGEGQIFYGSDIYDQDVQLINLISKIDGYPLLPHTKNENFMYHVSHSVK